MSTNQLDLTSFGESPRLFAVLSFSAARPYTRGAQRFDIVDRAGERRAE